MSWISADSSSQGTSFGGKRPPESVAQGCIRLANGNNEGHCHAAEAGSVPFIRYEGGWDLTKKTYMRFDRPFWANVKKVPFAKVGGVMRDNLRKTAAECGLRPDHPSWNEVRRVEAELEEEKAEKAGGEQTERGAAESQASEGFVGSPPRGAGGGRF